MVRPTDTFFCVVPGADPNLRAADGCSPLHYAAREDSVRSVELLLLKGADVTLKNNEGNKALDDVYDENDDDGAAIAKALRKYESDKKEDQVVVTEKMSSASAGTTNTTGAVSGTNTRVANSGTGTSQRASTSLLGLALGGGGDSDDALEWMMGDMAALLRAGASAAAPATTSHAATVRESQNTDPPFINSRSTSNSGSGGSGDSAASAGRTITPKAYVPFATHDEPAGPRTTAKSVKITLTKNGTLRDCDYENVRHEYLASGAGAVRCGDMQPNHAGGVVYERVAEIATAMAEFRRGEASGT